MLQEEIKLLTCGLCLRVNTKYQNLDLFPAENSFPGKSLQIAFLRDIYLTSVSRELMMKRAEILTFQETDISYFQIGSSPLHLLCLDFRVQNLSGSTSQNINLLSSASMGGDDYLVAWGRE